VMFKKVLVIDNFDSFTFNLVDYIEQQGCEVTVLKNDIDLDVIEELGPDLIVLSPGPSTPSNAGNLMEIIERYHDKVPMFGVCLGHEAFIEYFGGSLKLTIPVHGKASNIRHDGQTLFSDLEHDFPAGRYHSLVAEEVPDCFEVSASCEGESSSLVMAIRHKSLPIEGVQFHPESVLSMKGHNGFKLMENVIHKRFSNV